MSSLIKHPCRPDCPLREGGCKSYCSAWKEYESKKLEERKEKEKEIAKAADYVNHKKEVVEKFRRFKRKK